MYMTRRQSLILGAAALASGGSVLSACTQATPPGSTPAAATQAPAAQAAASVAARPQASPVQAASGSLADVKAAMDQARGLPKFTPPGPPVDASKAKGKSLFYLTLTMSVPIVQEWWTGVEEAAKVAGLVPTVFDGKGQDSEIVRGFQLATAQKVDCIVTESISSNTVSDPIRRAREAGIKVIVGNERNDANGGPAVQDIDGAASLDYVGAARYEADWVLADSNGQANVAVFKLPNAPAHDDMVDMIQSRFATCASSCKVARVETVAVQDWGTRLPVLTRSILTSDPSINYFIPLVDSPSQFIVPAIRDAGLADKVKISTFNGTPAILHLLKDGNVVGADIGGANIWESWSYVDIALRVLTGMPPVREPVPLRVFDRTNIDSINIDVATGEAWYDTQQAKDGFKKLWNLA